MLIPVKKLSNLSIMIIYFKQLVRNILSHYRSIRPTLKVMSNLYRVVKTNIKLLFDYDRFFAGMP